MKRTFLCSFEMKKQSRSGYTVLLNRRLGDFHTRVMQLEQGRVLMVQAEIKVSNFVPCGLFYPLISFPKCIYKATLTYDPFKDFAGCGCGSFPFLSGVMSVVQFQSPPTTTTDVLLLC